MMNSIAMKTGWILIAVLFFWGCGPSGNEQSGQEDSGTTESELSAFEMEHGIGPVEEPVTLGELDPEMIKTGAQLFKTKCSACHRMEERYVGPALGDVFESRTPTYVMNMVLNPDEMVKRHPDAKKMLAEYLSPMPNQNLTREQARAIVEYLASSGDQDEK